MAAGSTYTPIASTTATGSQSTITFSSISQTYTDLVLVVYAKSSVASDLTLTFNSSSTGYSYLVLTGTGSTPSSAKGINQSYIIVDYNASVRTGDFTTDVINIQNYSNSTTYKTVLSRCDSSTGVDATVCLWRNTNAITQIDISGNPTPTFASGSTFTLYGIAAA